MRWMSWVVTLTFTLGCGRKDEPSSSPKISPDTVVAVSPDASRPDYPDVEPTSPPPKPTVKPGKGDCKVEYAPKPARDPNPMCKVPALNFRMGTDDPDKKWRAERPAFDVELSPYYLDQHEVTTDQIAHYLSSVKDNDCPGTTNGCICAKGCSPGDVQLAGDRYVVVSGRERMPATHVTYEGARRYCAWAGKQLPTEAQWEAAARIDPATHKAHRYPWGEKHDHSRYADPTRPQPVGTFDGQAKPDGSSALGVHDLAGNVSEWMAGCWLDYPLCPAPPCKDPGPAPRTEGCSGIQRSGGEELAHGTARWASSLDGGAGFRCARPGP